jgi:hypothetical protein
VVRNSVEDGCFAGAAGAFPTGWEDADAGLLDRVEDGRVRWDGQGKFALGEVDLERIVQYGFGVR